MSDSPFQSEHFAREDESPDPHFYGPPRHVAHIDDEARTALTRQMDDILPNGGDVLDLMASYYSHLPDRRFRSVIGLGLNAEELSKNAQLSAGVVHDVNERPDLPFRDDSFDACILTVSIQYATRPIELFGSVRRILRSGGVFMVAYANRMFPTKAIALWRAISMADRGRLVQIYCQEAGGFRDIQAKALSSKGDDEIHAVTAWKAA